MNEQEKQLILKSAQIWFKETIAANHIKNTVKLKNINAFNINPFLVVYLANFLCGNSSPKSLAKALIYPRVLGTSITTSFGENIQKFTSNVLSAYGSTTSGIDIEFRDCVDNEYKYCQLKAGPQTINKDDIKTIADHFNAIINLGRTNNLKLSHDNMIVGILYGKESDLSANYKGITKQYHFPVIIGEEFWTRLTGDADFYSDLIKSIGVVAIEADFKSELDEVIEELAKSPELVRLSAQS